jgi:Kef-type K+ transport system membrane component KefB
MKLLKNKYTTIILALIISVIAVIGKLFAGVFLPSRINKWMVGIGMTPRGEIGLIFAIAGLNLKIIDNSIFAVILLMIVFTSIITPVVINYLVKSGR